MHQPTQTQRLLGQTRLGRSYQQTDNGCEQSHGFDKSRDDQHGGLDTTSRFWLTGNTFHGTTTNPTNTQTSTDSGQTSANSGTHYSNTTRGFQQQSKQHCEHETELFISETKDCKTVDSHQSVVNSPP
jgi:hypothetical protein